MELFLPILLGYILDQILGDPPEWPHPVRWIGRLIQWLERPLRALPFQFLAGLLLSIIVISIPGFLSWALLHFSRNEATLLILGTIFCYFGFAGRSLKDHALAITRSLQENNLSEARTNLSKIVGRDTSDLDETQISRATIESIAESSLDGIVAPLFYAALGGPVGLWIYKSINTLDSMIGYTNEKYRKFGWAAARLDDVANFIPARLLQLLIPVAATLIGLNGRKSLLITLRDGHKHPSPNAGRPEAAMAGALGVQLGGPSCYNGITYEKPLLGDNLRQPGVESITSAIRVAQLTGWLMLVVSCGTLWAVNHWICW